MESCNDSRKAAAFERGVVMFTTDEFFNLAMQQKHGITGLHVTTRARFVYGYLDELGRLCRCMQPVLVFTYCNASVEKAMPMVVKDEWLQGSAGVSMRRVWADCAWTADDIDKYIGEKVAALRDNRLVRGESV
jgi:hypothetical protein